MIWEFIVSSREYETKEQVDILKKTKAEMIQGFYFGKPVPKKNFMKPLSQSSGAYHTNVRLLLTQSAPYPLCGLG